MKTRTNKHREVIISWREMAALAHSRCVPFPPTRTTEAGNELIVGNVNVIGIGVKFSWTDPGALREVLDG